MISYYKLVWECSQTSYIGLETTFSSSTSNHVVCGERCINHLYEWYKKLLVWDHKKSTMIHYIRLKVTTQVN